MQKIVEIISELHNLPKSDAWLVWQGKHYNLQEKRDCWPQTSH